MTTESVGDRGAKHWDGWNLQQLASGLADPDRRRLTSEAVAEFRAIGVPPGASLLDVGIGAGWTTLELHAQYDYLGVDLGEESIAAVKKQLPNANVLACDFAAWDVPKGRFDAVLCVDTIAYFVEQDVAVQKMHAALKPGGKLVMTSVNPFVYSRLKWVGPPGKHQVRKWLGKQSFHSLLERNGFVVDGSRTIAPSGDQGWLRLVNGRRVNKLLGSPYLRLKEALGLGQFRIVTAHRG